MQESKVLIYAGTVRSGGSRTILAKIIRNLKGRVPLIIACSDVNTVKYLMNDLDIKRENIIEFALGRPSYQVYLISKVLFLFKKYECVISLNQHIPSRSKEIIYFINMFNFIKDPGASFLRNMILRVDGFVSVYLSDIAVFESNYLKSVATKYFIGDKNKLFVEYAGLEKNVTPSSVNQVKFADRKRVLLAVSSPSDHKKIELTIAIFDQMKVGGIVDRLVLVGGQSRDDWGSVVDSASKSLRSSIIIKGPVSLRIIRELYQESLFSVCTSEIESFYMVALESLYNGCPVLIRNVSSAKESIGDAGLIFDENDIEAIVDSIKNISYSEYDKLVSSGIQYAKRFTEENTFDIYKYL
jgi:glycosyltransferase involved in cell wall biosynthesis